MALTTPQGINEVILDFCREIVPTTKPVFLELYPTKEYIYGECYGVVENHIKKNGGKIQYGWIIWEIPSVFIEAEFHAVWVNDDGEYIDITPKVDGEKSILFLPDNKREFTGEPIDNIRKPLVDNGLTRNIVETGKLNFELKKSMKTGRNKPCPCGSGKKYKRCCGKYNL